MKSDDSFSDDEEIVIEKQLIREEVSRRIAGFMSKGLQRNNPGLFRSNTKSSEMAKIEEGVTEDEHIPLGDSHQDMINNYEKMKTKVKRTKEI